MAVGSIVDYLNSRGQNSSYGNRKKMAQQYGINNYTGSAAQNNQLLNTLRSGGSVPQTSSQPVITPVTSSGPGIGPGAGPSPASQYVSGYKYNKFSPSQHTNDYADRLDDLENNKPGDYTGRYDQQIQDIINSIKDRPKFDQSQVFDSDLYKQYREQYMQQGDKAMRDTMGNAAAMSGGYGSTFASAAGQQAYDGYMSQLGDKTMDIYDREYNKYLNEGQDMYNQLGMYNNQDSIDYGRYRDTVGDYYNDLNYYAGRYDSSYNKDYGEYQGNEDAQRWAEQYAYQKTQDALAQSNWQTQFDYQKQQDAQQYALQQQQLAASRSRGGGGGSSKSNKNSKLDPYAEKARRLLNGEDGIDKHKYSSQAVVANLMNHGNLSKEDALKAVEMAKAKQYVSEPKATNNVDDKKTDKYYGYAKNYAETHEPNDVYKYLEQFYDNGTISAQEADEILRRLGID